MKKIVAMMTARPATPPITPPTTAPVSVFVEIGEEDGCAVCVAVALPVAEADIEELDVEVAAAVEDDYGACNQTCSLTLEGGLEILTLAVDDGMNAYPSIGSP